MPETPQTHINKLIETKNTALSTHTETELSSDPNIRLRLSIQMMQEGKKLVRDQIELVNAGCTDGEFCTILETHFLQTDPPNPTLPILTLPYHLAFLPPLEMLC